MQAQGLNGNVAGSSGQIVQGQIVQASSWEWEGKVPSAGQRFGRVSSVESSVTRAPVEVQSPNDYVWQTSVQNTSFSHASNFCEFRE